MDHGLNSVPGFPTPFDDNISFEHTYTKLAGSYVQDISPTSAASTFRANTTPPLLCYKCWFGHRCEANSPAAHLDASGAMVTGPLIMASSECAETRAGICLLGRRCANSDKHHLKWAIMTPMSARVLVCPYSLVGVACPHSRCTLAHAEDQNNRVEGIKHAAWAAGASCREVEYGWCMAGLTCLHHSSHVLKDIFPTTTTPAPPPAAAALESPDVLNSAGYNSPKQIPLLCYRCW